MVKNEPTCYRDTPTNRVLDLRRAGADALPALSLSKDWEIRAGTTEHVHVGCVEIVYCVHGCVPFVAAGQDCPIYPGQIFISLPDQPHWMRTVPRGLFIYRILFRIPARGETALGLSPAETKWLVGRLTGIKSRVLQANPSVKAAFENLFAAYDRRDETPAGRKVLVRTAALTLVLDILDSVRNRVPTIFRSAVGQIVERMREHPEDDFAIAALAREAGLSHVTFTATVKAITGMTPHAFLIFCRIERSKRELVRGSASVSAIAQRLGFCSARHFATSFKRTVGLTPSAYRSSARWNEAAVSRAPERIRGCAPATGRATSRC